MVFRMRFGALRISLVYIVISILWITFSDQLLFLFGHRLSNVEFLWLSSAKGYFFVLITGVLLLFLIRSDNRKLHMTGAQYRDMYDSNPNPMWIYDPGTLRFVSVNDAATDAYGYTREEFLSRSILDIRPVEDRSNVIAAAARLEGNINQSGTWRHVKKDGREIIVNITSHQILFNGQTHILVMARDVTEYVIFEQKLERMNQDLLEERRKLRDTQLFTKVAGWEFYPAQRLLVWSDEVYQLTGLDKTDGRDAFDIYLQHIYPEDRSAMTSALEALITEGKQLDVTHRIIALDGSTRYIRQLARLDDTRDPGRKIIGSLQDITEFKQLEHERNKYLYNFENTLNSISDAFFALDTDMNIIRVNDVFLQLIGKKEAEVVGGSIFKLFPKEQNKLYPAYQRALEERVIVRREDYSIVLGKWIRLAAYPTDEGVGVYFSDVTEDKLKDLKLKEAVERYELVSQATKDVVYDLDMIEDKLIYNTSLTQLVSIPVNQIGHDLSWWRALIHPDDIDEVVQSQAKISGQGLTNWECEYRINVGDGVYKYVMDQGYFVYDAQKKPIRLIGAIKDIDALKRSTQENKKLADMIRRVNNMIIVTDPERTVQWVNEAFEEQTGYKLQEICGRQGTDLLVGPDTNNAVLDEFVRRQSLHETFASDILIYTRDKTPVWISAQLSPAYSDGNVFQGYVIICQNITLRREKDEEIRQQNELLREVAWMSSHQIRKPVATMLGLINLLKLAQTKEERDEVLPLLECCAHEMDDVIHRIHEKIPSVQSFGSR